MVPSHTGESEDLPYLQKRQLEYSEEGKNMFMKTNLAILVMNDPLWLWRLSNHLYVSIACFAVPIVVAALTVYRRNRKPVEGENWDLANGQKMAFPQLPEPSDAELKIAAQLITQQAGAFAHADYADGYALAAKTMLAEKKATVAIQ